MSRSRRSPSLGLVLLLAASVASLSTATSGCKREATETSVPMGSWDEWQTLDPLVRVGIEHVDDVTRTALLDARQLLARGLPRSADERLRRVGGGAGKHWISIARADLVATHYSVCTRGIALRLEDVPAPAPAPDAEGKGKRGRNTTRAQPPKQRLVDMSTETKLGPSDVSIEALLENLEAALATKDRTLVVQGRIARARLLLAVAQCPANDEVAERASTTLRGDLAVLASEAHLTPDLALAWGGALYAEYSPSAARPFVQQAVDGGYPDPVTHLMLAMIALEERDTAGAERDGKLAAERYLEFGADPQAAQAFAIRGDAARLDGDVARATRHYAAALQHDPAESRALVGNTRMLLDAKGDDAAREDLARRLAALASRAVDVDTVMEAGAAMEGFVAELAEDLQLSELARDAVIDRIDDEDGPLARALRYTIAAMLDARLGDAERARGHAATAETELDEWREANPDLAETPLPFDPRDILDRLGE
jgi:hypothetical protein